MRVRTAESECHVSRGDLSPQSIDHRSSPLSDDPGTPIPASQPLPFALLRSLCSVKVEEET
jgi:hypothetical protein